MINTNQSKFRKLASDQAQEMNYNLNNKVPKSFTIRLKRPLNKLCSLQKDFNEDLKYEKKNELNNNKIIHPIEKEKTVEITEENIRASKLFQSSIKLTKKYKKKINRLQNQITEKSQENTKLQQELKHYQDIKKKQLKKILKLLKEKAELQEYIAILQDQLHSRYQEENSYDDDFENITERDLEVTFSQQNQNHDEVFERTFQLHQRRINEFRDFILQLQSNSLNLFPENQFNEINTDQMTYEQLIELQDQIGYVNKGLTQEEIDRIPIIEYKSPDNKLDQDICPICQCQWEQGDFIKSLQCNHNYHQQCVDEWLHKNKNCPVCKQDVLI